MTTFTHHPRNGGADWQIDLARTYVQPAPAMKPEGFWLSVDGDWRRWCDAEGWGWTDHETEFQLDTHRCLWIKSAEELDAFHAEYSAGLDGYYIDWNKLVDRYAGIIIAPYLWERRLSFDVHWYYGWDCASACIWDLSAVGIAADALELQS